MTVGFAVAAPQSGSGKTTVTLSLVLALRARGLRVQTYKVGPDYLDASLLAWASGRPCRNLDAWMVPEAALVELFERGSRGADVAIVEGVMGLFDGRSGDGDLASTAHIARLLGLPVLIVVDVHAVARTAGAVALGLSRADPRLETAGVVLNRVAGERHLEACRAGVVAAGLSFLGHLNRMPALELPERYLGLVGAEERAPSAGTRRALRAAAGGVDLDGLLRRARVLEEARTPPSPLFPERRVRARTAIAVARDAAFNFYYQDSLDLLEAWGAELVPFSPLADASLPDGVGGVYLGGGYPELHASDLAANHSMLASLRRAHRRGVTVYAECGGAMYVGGGIEDAEGRRHRMAGLWPGWTSLRGRRLKLGYRSVRTCPGNLLHPLEVHAHEFHYSRAIGRPRSAPAWEVLDEDGRTEGWASARLLASYIHLHLGAQPGLAQKVAAACS